MPAPQDKVLCGFTGTKADKIKLAADYETGGSYETACLALWCILEDGLKLHFGYRKRAALAENIARWSEYLSGESKNKRPKEIRNWQEKCQNLPSEKEIRKDFAKCSKLLEVMHPGSKWRRRRNRIAHGAEKFGHKKTYLNHKADLLQAIEELHQGLAALHK